MHPSCYTADLGRSVAILLLCCAFDFPPTTASNRYFLGLTMAIFTAFKLNRTDSVKWTLVSRPASKIAYSWDPGW